MTLLVKQPELGVKWFGFCVGCAEDTLLHSITAPLRIRLHDQGWSLNQAKKKKKGRLEIE